MPATTTATTTAAVAAELTASLRAHLADLEVEANPSRHGYPDDGYVLAFPGHPLFYVRWTEAVGPEGWDAVVRHSAGSILRAHWEPTLERALALAAVTANAAGEHPTPELWRHAIEREQWSVREAIEMIERAAAR